MSSDERFPGGSIAPHRVKAPMHGEEPAVDGTGLAVGERGLRRNERREPDERERSLRRREAAERP